MCDNNNHKAQVFISYAHADNQTFDKGALGWVSNFVDHLTKAIPMKPGGKAVSCWMDHRLEPQRAVDETLRARIQESACIVAFMSPAYLSSPWCRLEMDLFINLVGGGKANNRVFLVELLETKREDWHHGIQSISVVQFWDKAINQPEPITLGWPEPDTKNDRKYWLELSNLASVLARQIQNLAPTEPPPQASETVADSASQAAQPTAAGPLRLIINADVPDRELGRQARDLLDKLDELNVEAVLAAEPAANQLPAEYRNHLETQLAESHGVLIVYGQAPASWAQAQYSLASKVMSCRSAPIWGGVLDGPPPDKPESGLPRRRLKILDCRNGGIDSELKGFVETLRQGIGHV
ncbi:toll/interleukin-1 receptor domain-containing protein [Methylomonas sp. UP202]|uniref:toll/interleukin-1 receptor domain-containing protein n=1 Tax=Methylomonas sp. UP202 TaxID=3040943 RepID=UPI00247B106E|nr:toll/interleukin-1 receptor domain-containing protein [Methylomonas sp. UP202]WGS88112.1 toll/interleukin-1 receptor domain-containing protein [Methylomonas sp. UP202]